jgi:cell division transport system permease protein
VTAAIRYFLVEAASSLWRRRGASIVAIITIAAAMAIPAGFAVAMANVDRLLTRWQESAEISVFLRDGATAEQRAEIERQVDASGLAAQRGFVSKTDALRRFRELFPDLGAAAASLDDNPLPASVEVRLRPERASGADVDRFVARLGALPGVADVRADRNWLARVTTLMRVARGLGIAVALLLALAAAFTVANVVRLAAAARRDEIEIMQLVGAPAVYVRGPFVAEGVMQGGAGALLAIVALWAGFLALQVRYGTVLTGALGLSGLSFLTPAFAFGLVAGGMAIGCLGGYIAARGVRTT